MGGSILAKFNAHASNPSRETVIPPYLKQGDTIGITCPSGFMPQEDMKPAIKKLQEWGLNIKLGSTTTLKDGTFGGSDRERANDFQQFLDNKDIKAIYCARGGYGAIRMIDLLNFDYFLKYPKWIIGFSDATVFHTHINNLLGVASIHAKMLNSYPKNFTQANALQQSTIESIRNAIMNISPMTYTANYNTNNRLGTAEGAIVGGNLRTIESLSGTASEIDTNGKILFIEETGEYLYSIDRMLWSLKRSAKLSNIKGLIVGGIKTKPQENIADELNKSIYDIVLEKMDDHKIPVCFDFPVGHQINNFALKCGVNHYLSVEKSQTILKEII